LIISDLKDGGASHIASTVKEIKKRYFTIVQLFFYSYIYKGLHTSRNVKNRSFSQFFF